MTEPTQETAPEQSAKRRQHSMWTCNIGRECKECGSEHYEFHAKTSTPPWDCAICQSRREERKREEAAARKEAGKKKRAATMAARKKARLEQQSGGVNSGKEK